MTTVMHSNDLSDRAVESLIDILNLKEIKTPGGRIAEEYQEHAAIILRALHLYQCAILEECGDR